MDACFKGSNGDSRANALIYEAPGVSLKSGPHLDSHAAPHPDFRDSHASVGQPAYRDLVQPRSGVQTGAKSVSAALVCTHARNIEVLTDLQPMNALGDLAVLARRLDPWTKVGMSQGDAVLVAAQSIDDLLRRDGTVGVDPVAPPPTVGGGQVGDLLAVASCRRW